MREQLQGNTERDNTTRGVATVATVNQFLLTLITKRLYEDLAEQELLWRVAGYLGSFDNKLRNDRVFWGVTLTDGGSHATDSLKLTIPKEVLERSAAKTRDYVCASGSLRVSQQFKASSFEVYLLVTDIRLLDAPGVLQSRREEASTLQTLKALASSRAGFPAKTRPKITVIHSRSQEAQVYTDFCQPLRPFDSEVQLEAIPANMWSGSELVQALRRRHRRRAGSDPRRWRGGTIRRVRSSGLPTRLGGKAGVQNCGYRSLGKYHSTGLAEQFRGDHLQLPECTLPSCCAMRTTLTECSPACAGK